LGFLGFFLFRLYLGLLGCGGVGIGFTILIGILWTGLGASSSPEQDEKIINAKIKIQDRVYETFIIISSR